MITRHLCHFIPPHVVEHMAKKTAADGLEPGTVQRTAVASEKLRQQRRYATNASLATLTPAQPGKSDRKVYDDLNQLNVDVSLIRCESEPIVDGANANAAYEALGATRAFYQEILGRDSIDNVGSTLVANVNFGTKYDNAFWDGERMVFGNGDNVIFKDFTGDVDVPGHELTHGVTQYTAGLQYTDQPGALNEAFSDIFGSCVDQYAHQRDAGEHNWLIGEDVMADGLYGEAIRSMSHPGTAYDNAVMGHDPQPGSMAGYVAGGDPHVNSGIINRAFYLTATDLGTFPAAKVWYATLQNLWPTAQFADAAHVCGEMARILARDGVVARQAPQTVRAAFHEVGVA
jgi:Zn-dependent metalloprotease